MSETISKAVANMVCEDCDKCIWICPLCSKDFKAGEEIVCDDDYEHVHKKCNEAVERKGGD